MAREEEGSVGHLAQGRATGGVHKDVPGKMESFSVWLSPSPPPPPPPIPISGSCNFGGGKGGERTVKGGGMETKIMLDLPTNCHYSFVSPYVSLKT